MIQRVQSIWLVIATACIFLTYRLPFYIGTNAKGNVTYELNANENIFIMLLTLLAGILTIVTFFLFKQRPLQLKLCVLGILLEAILIFLYYREVQIFSAGSYALWALLHSVIVICFMLAARAINKDEKLIKDSDRLR